MRRLRKLFMRFGLLLVIAYGGICAYMYFQQESFLFHPTVLAQDHAFAFEDDFEEVWLDAADGARLNALLFKAPQSRGVVLYLHGNGGNIGNCGERREFFLRNGMDFFCLDYRAFGKSTGELSQEGLYADATTAWQYLKERYGADRIIIYGRSMGSGIATHLAKARQPKKLILETPYTSILDVAKGQYPWLPIKYLLRYPLPSTENLRALNGEVLIFHGTKDEVIPYTHSEELVKAANKARLITFEGGTHENCAEFPAYHAELDAFLRNL